MSHPPPDVRGGARLPVHLALVGLMGSGKTSVGSVLAERLGRPLIDTDTLVEQATALSIGELFATRGEPAFRRYELESLGRALARVEPAVIATGGGVVTTSDARRMLRLEATVVWLRAEPDALAGRLAGDTTRPLLGGRDPVVALREMHEHRAPLYEEVSDAVVDVDHRTPNEVAETIIDVLGWGP